MGNEVWKDVIGYESFYMVSKLSYEKASEIRSIKNMSQRKIASIYGVGHGCIGKILRGQTWK